MPFYQCYPRETLIYSNAPLFSQHSLFIHTLRAHTDFYPYAPLPIALFAGILEVCAHGHIHKTIVKLRFACFFPRISLSIRRPRYGQSHRKYPFYRENQFPLFVLFGASSLREAALRLFCNSLINAATPKEATHEYS